MLPSSRSVASSASDSARAWAAVLSISVASFVLVTTEFLPVGLLTDISAGLGVSDGTAGLTVTVPGIVAALAAPLVTIGAGRMDRRYLLLGLTLLLVTSNIVAATAPVFAVLLAARVLLGIAVGGFWASAISVGGRLVGEASLPKATALILAGVSIGTVVGVPVGAFISNIAGWRVAFGAAGAVAAVALVAQFLLLPRLPTAQAIRPRDLLAIFASPHARFGLLAVILMITGHFAAYTYVTPLLKGELGLGPDAVTGLLLAYGAAGFVGNFAGSIVAARSLRLTLALAAGLLGLAVLLLGTVAGGLVGAGLLVALWGFAFGAVPLALQLWMVKSAPRAMEGGSALFVSIFQVALASGALLGGVVVDQLDVPSAIWGGSVPVLLTLAAIWAFGHAPDRQRVLAPAE